MHNLKTIPLAWCFFSPGYTQCSCANKWIILHMLSLTNARQQKLVLGHTVHLFRDGTSFLLTFSSCTTSHRTDIYTWDSELVDMESFHSVPLIVSFFSTSLCTSIHHGIVFHDLDSYQHTEIVRGDILLFLRIWNWWSSFIKWIEGKWS